MDIVSTALGLLKSGLDVFLSIFNKKNEPDIRDREKQKKEQEADDKADKLLQENDIDKIRDEMGN